MANLLLESLLRDMRALEALEQQLWIFGGECRAAVAAFPARLETVGSHLQCAGCAASSAQPFVERLGAWLDYADGEAGRSRSRMVGDFSDSVRRTVVHVLGGNVLMWASILSGPDRLEVTPKQLEEWQQSAATWRLLVRAALRIVLARIGAVGAEVPHGNE